MSKQHRLVLVNYLNTLPLLAGLRAHLDQEVDLVLAHPADCAKTFFSGEANIGLIPVGALIHEANWHQVSQYGIGCDGPVATVCLFGHSPIEAWDRVYLDYQSRTSVLLARLLLNDYWKIHPLVQAAQPGFETEIKGTTGGLIIGDRAIEARETYPYCYDLGSAWKSFTGHPFVFAIWASREPVETVFEAALDQAFEEGLEQIPRIATSEQSRYPNFDLSYYYRRNIRYRLDPPLLHGMDHFFELARKLD
ncbi:MAG: menaquinone biosynthesis protein [Saprospiraceae bacterium]|nr:menaquinone biosynthesis protein [Saprospiraceae bacterium]